MDLSVPQKLNLKTEAIAGITTFFTMAYIVIVNPQILSAEGKTGMAFTGVLTATVQKCRPDQLLKDRGGRPCFSDSDSDSADVLDHPGNTLGLYFARGFVSDGRAPPRDSSGDVRAGADLSWIAGTRSPRCLKKRSPDVALIIRPVAYSKQPAMNRVGAVIRHACLAIWLAVFFGSPAIAVLRDGPPQDATSVVFFDVSDLPARIDEPKLSKRDKDLVIDCAVANRSSEPLLGIRLVLLIVDSAGKLRSRITWIERAELAMYSIKTFAFHPPITAQMRNSDQLFLGIDEVIGRETIWRAAGAEKALRAYSRGQHDVMPVVRAYANKYDSPPGMAEMPPIRRKQ